jgi:hypothetical protein
MKPLSRGLASGIAAGAGEIIGKPYEDGSGNTYLALHGPRNAVDKVFKGVTLHP